VSNSAKYGLLHLIALLACILPPAAITVYYFPLWVERGGGASVSGATVFLLLICGIPLIKSIKEYFKSPSTKMLWFVGLIMFWLLKSIIDEMVVICFAGFIGNCIGTLFFKWRDKYRKESE
jgi:chromate transport protein ChrA